MVQEGQKREREGDAEPSRTPSKLEAIPEEDLEQELVGPVLPEPKKRRVLEHEKVYLDALPSAAMYERSYMHRDQITQVAVAQATDFIITGSKDGHLKFWKKRAEGIEFVKHFRAHLGAVDGLVLSPDSSLLVSFSHDKTVKVFDVVNFDMMTMLKLPYIPLCAAWIYKKGEARTRLAISDQGSPDVHVYDVRGGSDDPIHTFQPHRSPVAVLAYSPVRDTCISADQSGVLEYWSGSTYSFPAAAVSFRSKLDSDLYALAKAKAQAQHLEISKNGVHFAVICSDRRVRVFAVRTGKLTRIYDESLEAANELQRGDTEMFKLEPIDFGRRMAQERELQAADPALPTNAAFDESGNFLIYPTLLGIKVVNLVTNQVSRVIGQVESGDRYLWVALYQGDPRKSRPGKLPGAAAESSQKQAERDPTLIATAFTKERFYLFSKREPPEALDALNSRDVFNEKPRVDDIMVEGGGAAEAQNILPRGAIIHTTKGDIWLKLFPDECPKTVENFTSHAKNGYYDNIIFHRIIKGFMLQTGDPLGNGTGGQSIWGSEFEDEFSRSLRHDRPFTLSMANAGPGTNGSQFFITTVPTPWLDNKHTVFGRVVKGTDVILNIEKTKTDRNDKPLEDIKMVNIETKMAID
ncbi:hypothetical protein WJX74_009049 [Apatococcus lobatus]|uniref:peptidylprolyl isomerase n=1 Tax=Apatococcus lobatus TaxID=904363 RepID=A0AAW1Q8Z1_9CHLO